MATPTAWSDLTRPTLRPGFHVVRRDDRHLQVGLDPPHRLVIPDRPGLLETLTHLDRRPSNEVREVVDLLVRDGWVVDASAPSLTGRSRTEPAVTLVVDSALQAAVARACSDAHLLAAEKAPVHLVATLGEARRTVSDALMRADLAHLWLTVLPDSVRVGPYVEPGRTACLRCVDAHLGDLDPRRATVLYQLETLPPQPPADPDPCLLQVAAAWATHDIGRLLGGRGSSLRSATVTLTSDLDVTRREWLRHPHCGCAWG